MDSVSKKYTFYQKEFHRLGQLITPKFFNKSKKLSKTIYALNNLSIKVKKGQTLGVMGKNGSGKSTFLKLLCGVLQPTTGNIKIYGTLFPILELGSSFNHENSGLQNIYLNCTIHGFSEKKISKMLNEIIQFADIGEFIDMPVKTYSTGMVVRLAFAIAINIKPDILIIDEALAVGDEAFQRKCYSKIKQIQSEGTTLILVSHSSQDILQLCDTAFVLDNGTMILEGEPKFVVDNYQKYLNLNRNSEKQNDKENVITSHKSKNLISDAYFDKTLPKTNILEYDRNGMEIHNVNILDQKSEIVNILIPGKRYIVSYDVNVEKTLNFVAFGTTIKNITGLSLAGGTTDVADEKWVKEMKKNKKYNINFSFTCNLNKGIYFINVGAVAVNGLERHFVHRLIDVLSFKVNYNLSNLEYEFVTINPTFEIKNLN
jgi:lipopolysaccharide transport system ATP-binding protein